MSHDNAGVIDFTMHALARLRARVETLDAQNSELLAFARERAGADALVHSAVLALLEASSLEHALHIITADWVDMLGLDAIALGFEAETFEGSAQAYPSRQDVLLLQAGAVNNLIPHAKNLVLESVATGADLFGPASSLIRTQALIRLHYVQEQYAQERTLPLAHVGAGASGSGFEQGILALGTRARHHFDGIQSAPLLLFLGGVVIRTLNSWCAHARTSA